MTRAKNTSVTRCRRKKVLKQAKSFFGSKHKLFKTAKEQVMRSLVHAYIGRKQRKRFFRSEVWIPRLNSHVREEFGLRYSQFIHLKKLAHIDLNRKQLSEMIIKQPSHFATLIEKIRTYEKTPPSENSLASPAVS